MKIVISGSSGLVGLSIKNYLAEKGHTVFCLVRQSPLFNDEIEWDPETRQIDPSQLEGTDCFIHLSGESVVQRWSPEVKKRIFNSRIETTKFLAHTISMLSQKPSLFLCASGVGIYGAHPGYTCSEESPSGEGFLADICKHWEHEALSLQSLGLRVCCMRFGAILSPKGGMLAKLLPLFRLGLGGPIGDGSMSLSWISVEDVSRAICHTINSDLTGPVNFTGPAPETNYYFSKKLAHALHRPAFLPVPPFILKLILGEMAEETILSSIVAIPEKLLASGFQFQHPVLEIYFEDTFRSL